MNCLQQPRIRNLNIDICKIAKSLNHIYFYTELDISNFENGLKKSGITATAFFAKIIAKVISEKFGFVIGYKRRKMICWDSSIDIEIQVEKSVKTQLIPFAYIIRNTESKTLSAINQEVLSIRSSKENGSHFISVLPAFVRRLLLRCIRQSHKLFKTYFGSLSLTSIGSISTHCGYIHPLTISPFCVAIGSKKTAGDKTLQKFTFVFDHDLIDGGNCGRFIDEVQKEIKRRVNET